MPESKGAPHALTSIWLSPLNAHASRCGHNHPLAELAVRADPWLRRRANAAPHPRGTRARGDAEFDPLSGVRQPDNRTDTEQPIKLDAPSRSSSSRSGYKA